MYFSLYFAYTMRCGGSPAVQWTERNVMNQRLSKMLAEMEKKGTTKWGPASYPETTTHAAPLWFTLLVTLEMQKQGVIIVHTVHLGA